MIVKGHHNKSNTASRNTKGGGGKRQSYFSVYLIILVCVFGGFQVLIVILHSNLAEKTNEKPLALQILVLQEQFRSLQVTSSQYVDDGNFFPFTIRDSRRLVPTQIPKGFHVFDYVDVSTPNQRNAMHSQLFHSGFLVGDAPCQRYSIRCYKKKILQVFDFMLSEYPDAQYFFYMESDNDLCVSLSEIRNVAYQYERYFIATGIGFSGYIMSRQFVMDFLQVYRPRHYDKHDGSNPKTLEEPDPIASYLLIETNAWSVTRKYLVSHTIMPSVGSESLTINQGNAAHEKHLPKCFEPHRAKWKRGRHDPRDRFGWDYFDYDACPDADIFPCKEGQLAELVAKDLEAVSNQIIDVPEEKVGSKSASNNTTASASHRSSRNSTDGDGDDDDKVSIREARVRQRGRNELFQADGVKALLENRHFRGANGGFQHRRHVRFTKFDEKKKKEVVKTENILERVAAVYDHKISMQERVLQQRGSKTILQAHGG